MANITPQAIQKQMSLLLKEPTKQKKRKNLQSIISSLETHYKKLDIQNQRLRYQYYWLDRYRGLYDLAEKPAIHQAFSEGKLFNIFKMQESILKQAKNGYEIIMKVREGLTGQKIIYRIGIGKTVKGHKNAEIIQAEMGYKQLEGGIYVERHRGQLALRFTNSQKKIKEKSQQYATQTQKVISDVSEIVSEGSTLWSAVYRYKNDASIKTNKGNWGNAYQVYRYLYNRSPEKIKNSWKPHSTMIAEAFREVLGGGGSAGSFVHGGDSTLTQQDKFGSNITLTSINTIINIEQELTKVLRNFIQTDDTQAIINLLTRKQVGSEVIEGGYEEAVATIQEIFSSMKNN